MEFNPRIISGGKRVLLGELRKLSPTVEPALLSSAHLLTIKLEKLPLAWKPELTSRAQGAGLNIFLSAPGGSSFDALLMGNRPQLEKLAQDVEADQEKRSLAEAVTLTTSHYERSTFTLKLGSTELVIGARPCIMGVLNITPDSFYDGGRYLQTDQAVAQARRLVTEGADIIDGGGQSARPGADELPLEEERARVIPVVKKLTQETEVPISIDTYRSEVAREALDVGAQIVNDITALRGDRQMAAVVAEAGALVVLMHMQGNPRTMQDNPHYDDLMSEVCLYLRESLKVASHAGISQEQLIVDPGIGFGKAVQHNLEIIARLRELTSLGCPILIGPSRKSFIGAVLDLPAEQRLMGTLTSLVVARVNGAHIFRVHDVRESRQALDMCEAILKADHVNQD